MEGLRIAGDGRASAAVGDFGGSASASAKLIVLSFAVTEAPYPYTITGQLNGADCSTSSYCSKATAKLTGEAGTIFEEVGAALSESGTLPPGNYTLSVDVSASIERASDPTSMDSDANFTFTLAGPMSTPTPTPTPTPVTRATNLSTRLLNGTGDGVGIGGFIITGNGPRHLLIRGIGPSLSGIIANTLPDPSLNLNTVVIDCIPQSLANDDWRGTQEAEIIATGRAPGSDLESAIVADLLPGTYTVILGGDATGVGLVEIYDLSTNQDSRLANISTRGNVGTGDDIMIAGFILGEATGEDSIILRGIGPSLSETFPQLSGLPDPKLELRNSQGALIASDDNWMDDPNQAAIIQAAGLAPTNNLESAIATTLMPGVYTTLLSGINNGTGVGLVEVYELGAPANRPSNFSHNFEDKNCVIPRESAKW
jgi:hypothetical protein